MSDDKKDGMPNALATWWADNWKAALIWALLGAIGGGAFIGDVAAAWPDNLPGKARMVKLSTSGCDSLRDERNEYKSKYEKLVYKNCLLDPANAGQPENCDEDNAE